MEKTATNLSIDGLKTLPAHVSVPGYDPQAVVPGILHIGPGNFALAHLGAYINDVLSFDPTWGIIVCSIRTPDMVQNLRNNSNLYVLVERNRDERKASVLAPVVGTLFGPDNPQSVNDTIADARIKMVTFTISNKGYCLIGRDNNLDVTHPDVIHDLNPDVTAPKTIYWYLLHGLEKRMATNAPLTLVSLDNVPENGKSLKKGLMQFVREAGKEELANWIEAHVDFPVTTVDRITPQTTGEIRRESEELLGGVRSSVVVGTENFRHLAIEKSRFPMPAWDKVGVEVVDDCGPKWILKLIGLNSLHALVAMACMRIGKKYIHEGMENEAISKLVARTQLEYATFLPGGVEYVSAYNAKVRARFSDYSLGDTAERVGARGTSKIIERLLHAVELGLAANHKVATGPTFITACWLLNLGGEDQFGQPINLGDADAPKLQDIHQQVVAWARSQTAPATTADAPNDALRSQMINIGETLRESLFMRLASNEEFLRELSWALLNIVNKGFEQAALELLAR